MKTTTILEFDDFHPDDPGDLRCFKWHGGNWIGQEDVLKRLGETFMHITAIMDRGDRLTITLDVKPAEEVGT